MNEKLILYHYWRSSASWRVRLALKLKRIEVEFVAVDLLKGESDSPEHLKRNPLGFVPVLQVGQKFLFESVSIISWIEELVPSPSLFPGDSFNRAQIRTLMEIINSGTQPIQNTLVTEKYSSDENKRKEWNQFFVRRGLEAFQTTAQDSAGKFSVGDQITAADLYLIPQVYNANRFDVSIQDFPLLNRIWTEAMKVPEVKMSSPDTFKPASN
jgi:maleylacetoacetate isomerase